MCLKSSKGYELKSMFLRFIVIGFSTIFSSAAIAQDMKSTWAPQITDCAAFFGVWAQSDSASAETYRVLNTSFLAYSKYVYFPDLPDAEMAKSRRRIAMLLHSVRKGEDPQAVSKQMQLCLNLLKKAETDLWPRLPEDERKKVAKVAKDIIR
jgi:hypothetical protein